MLSMAKGGEVEWARMHLAFEQDGAVSAEGLGFERESLDEVRDPLLERQNFFLNEVDGARHGEVDAGWLDVRG
jgi:hypothetical protein